jgi:hypothetical protein
MLNALFIILLPRIILFFPAMMGYLASHIEDDGNGWRFSDVMRFFACLGLGACFCICGVNNGITADVMITLYVLGCLPRFIHLMRECCRDLQSLKEKSVR